jgi:hypothetical protein
VTVTVPPLSPGDPLFGTARLFDAYRCHQIPNLLLPADHHP